VDNPKIVMAAVIIINVIVLLVVVVVVVSYCCCSCGCRIVAAAACDVCCGGWGCLLCRGAVLLCRTHRVLVSNVWPVPHRDDRTHGYEPCRAYVTLGRGAAPNGRSYRRLVHTSTVR
jgi:hypothetical protein